MGWSLASLGRTLRDPSWLRVETEIWEAAGMPWVLVSLPALRPEARAGGRVAQAGSPGQRGARRRQALDQNQGS